MKTTLIYHIIFIGFWVTCFGCKKDSMTTPTFHDPDLYTRIPDAKFEERLSQFGDDVIDGYVLTSNIENITDLFVLSFGSLEGITDFTGIEDFTSLEKFQLAGNDATSLDLSQNTALIELSCDYNNLTSLDLSQNTALEKLVCHNNQLTSLDLSQNTALSHVRCDYNNLTSLNFGQNSLMLLLFCNDNQLTSLDVSSFLPIFGSLGCQNNQLTCVQVNQGQLDNNIQDRASADWGVIFSLECP